MNPQAAQSFDRIRTALLPDSFGVRDFVLKQTRLNGMPFSLQGHEFQGKVLELAASPDIDLVCQKPSQVGISEVVYRVLLSYMCRIQGFSAALVFPTVKMSNEVMATRISQIIAESPALRVLRSKDVDSSGVKMFLNGSILYSLGASANATNTVINRPIRMVVTDELARCDLGVVTALRSRQRHQIHKSSIYFSTPLFEGFDIDAEMEKCGVIWEQLFRCEHCSHPFFPDFYENVVLPGFNDAIKALQARDLEQKNLNLEDAYLCCPKCGKATRYDADLTEWVNVAEASSRPKVGIRLGAFALPKFVKPHNMLQDFLAYDDRNEFTQQVLGRPASKAETIMDSSRIQFVQQEAGTINVWGLDVGKVSHLTIGTVTPNNLFIHTRRKIFLKDLERELAQLTKIWMCVAGVIDFMPYTDISARCVNTFPNCWAALYNDPNRISPELFTLKIKEDEAIGNIRQVSINKTVYMDSYVNSLMDGTTVFSLDMDKSEIIAHHEAMRRIRNPKFSELRHMWVKPEGSKTDDHWFHSSIYCSIAGRLMLKGGTSALPMSGLLTSFRLKADI